MKQRLRDIQELSHGDSPSSPTLGTGLGKLKAKNSPTLTPQGVAYQVTVFLSHLCVLLTEHILTLWAILTPLGTIAPHGVLLVGAHACVHLSSRRLTWR